MAEVISPTVDEVAADQPLSMGQSLRPGQLVPVLIGLMLGMLLAAIDQTVVGTALPRIVGELHGFDRYTWVVTSYLLATTVGVPIYGKLSDIYGRRIFFIGGMVVFLIGSALSGTSQDMTQLIIYRGIQGLGAGALMPIAQAIIGDIFPPSERGKWQGLFVAVFGLATVVGPLTGGYITDNWGWRWVFYVNMPVGALALVAASLTIPRTTVRRRHRIDYLGSVLLIAWSVPLLLALTWGGNTYAWDSPQVLGLFGGAAVALIVFFVVELLVREPIISPRLFKSSIFTVSVLATFIVSAGMFGAIFYLPAFVQDVLGQSATNSGVVITPMMAGFIVSSIVGGQLLSRTGRYKILALVGFVIAAGGMYLLSRMTPATSDPELYRNMAITGLGIGVMISLFTIVVQNAFPYRQLGEVTATLTFFRTMGSTIGLAVLGSLMLNLFTSNLQSNLPAAVRPYVSASQIAKNVGQQQGGSSSTLQGPLGQLGPQGAALLRQLQAAIQLSLSQAITDIFLIGAGMMIVGFFVTLFLREIALRRTHTPEAGGPGAPAPVETVADAGAEVAELTGGVLQASALPAPAFATRPATPITAGAIRLAAAADPAWEMAGATLAVLAREAQRADADPRLLATLAGAVDGAFPHEWSPEQRGRAVAHRLLEPLAQALLNADGAGPQAPGSST